MDEFIHFKKTRVPSLVRTDMNLKGSAGNNRDEEELNLFNRSLKLNVTQLPEFNGQIGAWLYWKRRFMAMEETHSLGVMFGKHMVELTVGSTSEKLHNKKSPFSTLSQHRG